MKVYTKGHLALVMDWSQINLLSVLFPIVECMGKLVENITLKLYAVNNVIYEQEDQVEQ